MLVEGCKLENIENIETWSVYWVALQANKYGLFSSQTNCRWTNQNYNTRMWGGWQLKKKLI